MNIDDFVANSQDLKGRILGIGGKRQLRSALPSFTEKMLRNTRMAGLVKLCRSVGRCDTCQERAVLSWRSPLFAHLCHWGCCSIWDSELVPVIRRKMYEWQVLVARPFVAPQSKKDDAVTEVCRRTSLAIV